MLPAVNAVDNAHTTRAGSVLSKELHGPCMELCTGATSKWGYATCVGKWGYVTSDGGMSTRVYLTLCL